MTEAPLDELAELAEAGEPSVEEELQGELDLEGRRLCADGGCLGVIGADGRCSVCGVGEGEAPGERAAAEPASEAATEVADEELAARRLCPDGGCVGLIGDDGRCKVCGTVAD